MVEVLNVVLNLTSLFIISEDKRNRSAKIIGSSIGVSVLLLLGFIIFFLWKRKQKRSILIETPIGILVNFNSFLFVCKSLKTNILTVFGV